jgi:hypothetical protein
MYKIKIKLTLDDVDSCNALVDIIRELEDKLHDADVTHFSITKTKEVSDA